MQDLDMKYGFSFKDIQVDFDFQKKLLDAAGTYGHGHPLYHKKGEPECFKFLPIYGASLDDPHNRKVMWGSDFYNANLDKICEYDEDDFLLVNRFNEFLNREWTDLEITQEFYDKIFLKIKHLFKFVSRIIILRLEPGYPIPFHKETSYLGNYTDLDSRLSRYISNKALITPETEPLLNDRFSYRVDREHHKTQRGYGLRLPLTTVQGDNGNTLLKIGEDIVKYDTKDMLFALNEVDIFHGAAKTEFQRGVIYIDGILDMNAVDAESKAFIQFEPTNLVP